MEDAVEKLKKRFEEATTKIRTQRAEIKNQGLEIARLSAELDARSEHANETERAIYAAAFVARAGMFGSGVYLSATPSRAYGTKMVRLYRESQGRS